MEYVQPGDITGYYYILVAGLPWNCSWQRLKDVCKNQQPDGTCIEVEHVHVYPGETNGWVRVKGKQTFRKMMEHLNTAVIDNRCILADDRNETTVTAIKTAASPEFGSLPRRTRNDSSSSNDMCPSSTASYYNHRNSSSLSVYSGSEGWYGRQQPGLGTSPMSPTSPSVSLYQQSSQIYDNVNPISPYANTDYFQSPAPSSVVYAGSIPPATPVYVSSVPQSPIYTYPAPVPYPKTPPSNPATTAYVKPEARKIIITHLPHGTTYQQLQQLLLKYIARGMPRSSTDSQYDELHELNIVTNPDKRPRGHAFAVLGSEQIARYVVKSLDGLRFQGRELKARFAKEGVESATQYSTATEPQPVSPYPDYQYQSPEATQTSPAPRERERTVEYASQSSVRSLAHDDSEVKRESKERSRDPERKESSKKKNSSPLVVNGSSSERESKSKKYRSW